MVKLAERIVRDLERRRNFRIHISEGTEVRCDATFIGESELAHRNLRLRDLGPNGIGLRLSAFARLPEDGVPVLLNLRWPDQEVALFGVVRHSKRTLHDAVVGVEFRRDKSYEAALLDFAQCLGYCAAEARAATRRD
jgi:hypothetical protein